MNRTISAAVTALMLVAGLTAGPAAAEGGPENMPGDVPGVTIPANKDDFLIFLLAGQSNMAGRGGLSEADQAVNPRILMLNREGEWVHARDPVHYDKPIAGVGLARSFAAELADAAMTVTIGLVPAACGGSPIATWEPGAYHEQTDSHPYDDAIERTRRALQDGILAGILWHQGESDARRNTGPVYKDKLVALAERLRGDLEAPDAAFIIGQLGHFEGKPWNEARQTINEAHIEAAREIDHAGFVSSYGLRAKDDNTHFNTVSLVDFGKRYARKYLQVMSEANRPEEY
ncbi:MAG: sialate O-acetylesterase [Xanthomonadales bacterium]|nr:sialate O-acetylesterase [Xanthomonadales bacterium]NIX12859.1 sialate O-acetylesterase [Xanthomonadales bacterium]